MIGLPCRKTVWGAVNDLEDLRKAIAKSGQFFGEDRSGPACNYNPTYPCDKTFYEYMGWGLHKGWDIPVSTGTEIYAVADGRVVRVSDKPTQGIGIVVWHPKLNVESVYWHNRDNVATLGQNVRGGDLIAYSGNTGFSAGPHLHIQFNQTDENGVSGQAIDPFLYFTDETMTSEEVKLFYVLAFYREPDDAELAFWTGKRFIDMVKTAIKDRAVFLQLHS